MGSRDLERGGAKPNNNLPGNYSGSYYQDASEKQWTSWLVPMFVVANVAMFVVVMYVNNCPHNNLGSQECVARFLGRFSFEPLRVNPLFGPSSSTLQKLGALEWEKIVHGHQAWRLITGIWLHAGVIHLLANMLSLVFIGIRLEQQFGFIRVGILYLLSGLGGSILSLSSWVCFASPSSVRMDGTSTSPRKFSSCIQAQGLPIYFMLRGPRSSGCRVHDRVGDAISRGERKQPLQVVSLSKLCANIKMGMWELIRLVLISWYMSMNVFFNDDVMFPYVFLVERTV
ncbi:RHOMBOID-like protein 2 [Cucurbita argyrosperma subsp. argyrosperma]|nr:RHOMBOID-like protein 2 [Cucurbita argyrosperma subsp. argyrosperma]